MNSAITEDALFPGWTGPEPEAHLSDGGLRVEQEVTKRPLENPSELRAEAGGVGDGSEGGGGDHLLSLDDPL